jgi:hypothetical protein
MDAHKFSAISCGSILKSVREDLEFFVRYRYDTITMSCCIPFAILVLNSAANAMTIVCKTCIDRTGMDELAERSEARG